MKKSVTDTHVYFPTALHKKLKKVAKANRHTTSMEIVIAVENHIKVMERWEPTPPQTNQPETKGNYIVKSLGNNLLRKRRTEDVRPNQSY